MEGVQIYPLGILKWTAATPWSGGSHTSSSERSDGSEVRADQSFNRRSVVSGQFKFRAVI